MEDIYPLTIIAMSFGKYAIIEGECHYDCIDALQSDEEVQYNPDKYMSENWEYIRYGIGNSIKNAFNNFKEKYI